MASANWMKSTTQKAGAMKKHLGQKEREQGKHSNTDIDKSLSYKNYTLGCSSFDEALSSMKRRTKEVDKLLPPQRVRKDRVTCCFIELPCPRVLTEKEQSDEFFKAAYQALNDYFGAENVHGGFVHKDEVHTYIDKNNEKKTSLEHIHVLVSAYTPEKGINGKAFETKKRLKELNDKLDDMCFRSFGVRLNTEETPQRKSAERLKRESELQEKEAKLAQSIAQNEQKLAQTREELAKGETTLKDLEARTEPFRAFESHSERADEISNRSKPAKLSRNKILIDKNDLDELKQGYLAYAVAKPKIDDLEADKKEFKEFKESEIQKLYKDRTEAGKYETMYLQEKAKKQKLENDIGLLQERCNYYQRQAKKYLCEKDEMQQQLDNVPNEVTRQVNERLTELFSGNMPTKRERRLEEFCDRYKLNDGRTILEAFNDEEFEREVYLKNDNLER